MESVQQTDKTIALDVVHYMLDIHIMFSALPATAKRLLAPLFESRPCVEGDIVARQGGSVDGMYIIYKGRMRLKRHDEFGKIVSMGLIGQDSSFGELSLLEPDTWKNDIVAAEPSLLVFLPADKVRALLPKNPMLAEHFRSNVGLIEISQRLRALLGKGEYTKEQFHSILGNLGVKRVGAGKSIFEQGDEDPRLYLIEQGTVELVRTPGSGDPVSLDTCKVGALLGEGGALAPNGVQPHSAQCLTDTTVLVIRQQAVRQILEINPSIKERLDQRLQEFQEYEQEELRIRGRVEGVDLKIRLADAVTEEEFRDLGKKTGVTKFPEVRQANEREAAAACLTMLCKHYGKDFTTGQVRELTGLEGKSITPDDIIRGGEVIGFSAKAYSLAYDDLKTVKIPGIIGWEGYHYAVLFHVTDKEVRIADPARGIVNVPRKEFMASWSEAEVPGIGERMPDRGVFIAFEPTQAFERQEPPPKPIWHFVHYLMPHKMMFAEALLAAMVINVLGLASPLFVQTIVDTVVVHNDASLLNIMLAGMVLVALLSTAMAIVQNLLLAHTTARVDMRLMSEFYRHVLSLPMDFFLKRNKGEILTRFGENQKVRAIIAGSTITSVLNAVMIVLYFLMMFAYSFKLTIVVIVFIPLYIAIVLYFTPRIKKLAQEIFLTNAQSQGHLIESINAIETLKATSNEYFARARWENAFAENVNRSFRQAKLNLLSQSLFRMATLASSIIVLWIGATEVMAGTMTIGQLMGFNMLMGLVTAPVLQFVNLWNDLQEVRIAMDRVGDVINVKPEQSPVADPSLIPATLRRVEGRIEFHKVNFSYTTSDQTKYIMRDFDLVIEPGQHIALVGPSGCGKSTIAKMILGFNLPSSGEVLIDGKDLISLDRFSLRRNIGVVLQDSFVFSGTVAENIALGDPVPDMRAVQEAARLAGADEFIINYPQGYQTPIGEKGVGISGGQRQRICIARALYRRPRIMIFDEATSALDNESEERIIQQLRKVMHNRTSISIAHRLTTIMDADVIYYVADGKVQEKGAHKQLIDPEYLAANGYKGHYYHLARTQFDLPPLSLPAGTATGEREAG